MIIIPVLTRLSLSHIFKGWIVFNVLKTKKDECISCVK